MMKLAWMSLLIGTLVGASSCVAQDAANWTQFRGPNGLGVAPAQTLPAKFGGKDNLLWKSPVALAGASAPVVWGDKIFVSGGTTEKRQLYCFGGDGKLVWTQEVKWEKPAAKKTEGEEAAEEPELKEYVAANTPATDGKAVYALFGTGDVVAYDFTGKKLWHKSLWPISSQYGFCSSPLLYKNKLIVQLDHSGDCALIAFDTATGNQLWKTKRNAGDSFQSPILAETKSGPQIITATAGANIAYDPETGKELWSSGAGGTDDSPSPAYGNGIAVIAHSGAETQGIAVDGKGKVDKTHVKWTAEGAPEASSPVVVGDLAFVALNDQLVCYELQTGKKQWEHAIDEKAYASLVAVGDKVIFMNLSGTILVFKAANKYEELLKAELGEGVNATPAIANGRIYIRGDAHLFCFGAK
jgi:outer membrane protein assembly factor BamB